MIAWLFFTFLSLGVVLAFIGYFSGFPLFDMTGMIFIFLLGLSLLSNGLDYKTGANEVYVYGNDFDGSHWDGYNATAPPQTDRDAFLFHKNTTDSYDHYDDSSGDRFGWLLMAFGGLGFAFSLFRL